MAAKRAVVLHGYKGNPYVNWYPWLAWKLRRFGYKTWTPRLPMSGKPNGKEWTRQLLESDWDFQDSIVIGHSAGSVEILNLLMNIPSDVTLDTAVLVSAFRPNTKWTALADLMPKDFDFGRIRKRAKNFIVVHAADDPLCPVADARYYAEKLTAKLVILPEGGHFSIVRNIRYWRFPELIQILKDEGTL